MRISHRMISGTLAALLVTATLGATTARAAVPIHFPSGSTHGQGHGFLRSISSQELFTFSARRGQHLRVNIVGRGPTRGIVSFPGGGQDGSPGGVVFDDRAPRTGRYRLRVTEDSMAEQWRGPVTVYVTRR